MEKENNQGIECAPEQKHVENRFLKWVKKFFEILFGITGSILGTASWIIKTCIGICVVSFIFAVMVGGILFIKIKPELDSCRKIAYDKLVNMDEDDFILSMDTHIYDKDGNEIGLINAGNFEYVDINSISMNIQNTYISQEDKRFKEHNGVDLISTARAGLALLKNRGEITQGGSTITQQVIKNTYLTQEKSFKRKLIEVMLAPQLEMKFTKAKIMEYYCNTNYYGNRCYGVQAASQYYFGKDASDVSIAEAALLVGLSNSPSAYDPVKNPKAALEKRNRVIDTLFDNGYISEGEKEEAKEEELSIVKKEGASGFETYQSSYAIHCAALTLMKEENFKFQYVFENKEDYDSYTEKYDTVYSDKVDEIRSGGYNIYTSLDSTIQDVLQSGIDSVLAGYDELQENGKYAMQGAAAVLDNTSGYTVAIVGGRGTDDQFNRAYLSARQPGSAIKPLIDYAPAFDTGEFYPSKIMDDHEIEDGPKNSGGGFRGRISIREAVNRSINTIAWQIFQQIGFEKGLSYLGEMNFHKISHIDNGVASLSIGGFTNGLRVIDMAKGYQTLANYGEYNANTCIIDIKDSNENSVIKKNPEKKQVYEKDSAYLMTDLLKGTLSEPYGTGYGLALDNMPSAGKTGTTNNNKDTWFCGYTRYYTASVWVGYDTPREMPGIYGATYAGKIWKNVMEEIHTGLEVKDWEVPETVYESFVDPGTGEATSLETGVTDIFSSIAEIRAEELKKERQNEAFFQQMERKVAAYEKNTISGPEDTYSIEADFTKINNTISQIDDINKRNQLYDRIYVKYKELLNIREGMKAEILLYEKEQAEIESFAAEQAKQKAEEDRQNFIKVTRENAADSAISKIEALKYIPETDNLIKEAENALKNLKEYDSYEMYYKKMDTAIRKIETLPTRAEYEAQEAIRESEENAVRESEEAKRESMESEMNRVIMEESKNWETETNGTIIGPGAGVSLSGPGKVGT